MAPSSFKLYAYGPSVFGGMTHLAVVEKQIPNVEYINVDLAKLEHLTPDYLKINPNGTVPSVVLDGKIITESRVIISSLDSWYPELPPLLPADPEKRREAEMLADILYSIDYNGRLLGGAVSVEELEQKKPFLLPMAKGRLAAVKKLLADPATCVDAKPIMEKKAAQLEKGLVAYEDPKVAEYLIADTKEHWATVNLLLEGLDDLLKKYGGPYALGEQYSYLDVHLTSALFRIKLVKREALINAKPLVGAYFQALQQRPSWGTCMHAVKL